VEFTDVLNRCAFGYRDNVRKPCESGYFWSRKSTEWMEVDSVDTFENPSYEQLEVSGYVFAECTGIQTMTVVRRTTRDNERLSNMI
jgi:hypothetical protein